jgi:hypothetical protein
MQKEKFFAIFVGLIFILSMAGFAVTSLSGFRQPQNPGAEIPNIINRELAPEEKIYVLQTGRVLVENFYVSGCSRCIADRATLESFANRFRDFVVLEQVEVAANATNETAYVKLQMIGRAGLIEDLEESQLTEENLTDIFCDMALSQPRECLLRGI